MLHHRLPFTGDDVVLIRIGLATVDNDVATGGIRPRDQRPYKASAGASNPKSWNRYSYALGGPVNYNDPRGLLVCRVGGEEPEYVDCEVDNLYDPIEEQDPNEDKHPSGNPNDPNPTALATMLTNNINAMLKRLKDNQNCLSAIGAKSYDEALAKLHSVGVAVSDLGDLVFIRGGPNSTTTWDPKSGPIANATIALNSNVNWLNPANTEARFSDRQLYIYGACTLHVCPSAEIR